MRPATTLAGSPESAEPTATRTDSSDSVIAELEERVRTPLAPIQRWLVTIPAEARDVAGEYGPLLVADRADARRTVSLWLGGRGLPKGTRIEHYVEPPDAIGLSGDPIEPGATLHEWARSPWSTAHVWHWLRRRRTGLGVAYFNAACGRQVSPHWEGVVSPDIPDNPCATCWGTFVYALHPNEVWDDGKWIPRSEWDKRD